MRDMTDVDAVNERLNGLVTLLQAVGVGGDDVDRLSKGLGNASGGGAFGLADARQLNDDQVEALIRKLQQAQAEAPQIIAALEAHAEARSLSGDRSRGGGGGSSRQPQHQQQHHEEEEEEDDDDDDEYDENANYPMVGHGCSDDISVVSDLTTPTVVSSMNVPDEEHYRDTLPPMIIGGGGSDLPPMVINPVKKKNQLAAFGSQPSSRGGHGGPGATGPGGIAPPPRRNVQAPSRTSGAAASRRKNYQETMSKLHENPHAMGYAGPSAARVPPPSGSGGSNPQGGSAPRKAPSRKKSTEGAGVKKRVPKPTPADVGNFSELASSRAQGSGWGGDDAAGGWNAFGEPASAPRPGRRQSTGVASRAGATSKSKTDVDPNGFLVADSFDPFGSNPFKSGGGGADHFESAFSSSRSADGFDAFGMSSSGSGHGGGQPVRKVKKRPDGAAPRQGSGGAKGVKPPPGAGAGSQGRARRPRRASLAT